MNYFKYNNNIKICQEHQPIRVRIAPSPTGLLHIGTARTALFNYLFARKNKGKFILRIEDTDLERSNPQYEKNIIAGLKWLGIKWDEGPINQGQKYKGNYGPYRQNGRIKIYKKYIQRLLDEKLAYFCPCSEAHLEKERQTQLAGKQTPKHLCPHRDRELSAGIIRFKTPNSGEIKFNDLIHGEVKFDLSLIGDFSIAKALNIPLYNFAVVIDDFEMKISHVIRGEDHISNTPKQILLQNALGLPQPRYAHLPLILNPDRSKLSKRHAPVSINDYKKAGYLPEALINFIAFLGWNPKNEREIFSLRELEKEFSIEGVGKSGAIFNLERLDWLNSAYIKKLSAKKLLKAAQPYFKKITNKNDKKKITSILMLEQERLKKLSELPEKTSYFFTKNLKYPPDLLKWKNMDSREVRQSLQILCDIIHGLNGQVFASHQKLAEIILPEASKMGDRGKLLWPLRVALTGQAASPGPFEIMKILGKQTALQRLKGALRLAEQIKN